MSWGYAVHLRQGTKLADLSDYCSAVTILTEGQGGGRAGGNVEVGFLDGERWEPKTQAPANLILSTVIRYTDENGDVDHEDGPAGHFMENLASLHRLLGVRRRLLRRTAPHIGSQQVLFELLTDPVTGSDKNEYRWVLRALSGSWQDVTASSATGTPPSITTSGNRYIPDPSISFSGAGTFRYIDGEGLRNTITVASGPTFPVVVSQSNGEWTAVDDDDNDASPYVTTDQPWVMRFDPGQELTLQADVAVTVTWRNRWA